MPADARACPECGADERAGWDEDAALHDGLDLPAAAFEEEEGREPRGQNDPVTVNGIRRFWWMVGVVLLLAVGYLIFRL